MNHEKLEVKASVNDELLEDISGGIIPDSMGTGRCSVCGNIVPNLNLVNHHLRKVCKDCIKKIGER